MHIYIGATNRKIAQVSRLSSPRAIPLPRCHDPSHSPLGRPGIAARSGNPRRPPRSTSPSPLRRFPYPTADTRTRAHAGPPIQADIAPILRPFTLGYPRGRKLLREPAGVFTWCWRAAPRGRRSRIFRRCWQRCARMRRSRESLQRAQAYARRGGGTAGDGLIGRSAPASGNGERCTRAAPPRRLGGCPQEPGPYTLARHPRGSPVIFCALRGGAPTIDCRRRGGGSLLQRIRG